MSNFGEKLRELRESRGLGVNQLAAYSGVSPSLISKIENGQRSVPSPATLKKLSSPLKIEYKELMIMAGHWTGDYQETDEEYSNPKTDSDPGIQFIMRARKDLSPQAYERFLKLAQKMKESFEEEEDE